MRLTEEQLQALMKKNNCSRLWSWSKINCFHNSTYEYYLKYIKKIPEDNANSIYVTTGSISHDILEKYYNNEIKYEDMISDFDDGWTTAFTISDLKFDRNNEEHNKQIADKYYDNLVLFFKNHQTIKHKVLTEKFMSIKFGDNLFQGYIDCVYKDKDGCINIIDYKTSSIYTGKKSENECGQLVLYAMGLHQKGVPYNQIKIAWNFLKYVSVQYEQANGAVKTRNVERSKLGGSLQSNVKMWLKKLGFESDVDYYLKLLVDSNDIKCLPESVQTKYTLNDCYVYVSITDKLISKWTDYINVTIQDIKCREKDYQEMKEKGFNEEVCSKTFWDKEDDVKANSYYFSTLCGYSANLHIPYKKYLENLEANKNSDILLSPKDRCLQSDEDVIQDILDNGVDLSWLDEV